MKLIINKLKRYSKIIIINIALFLLLATILEVILQLSGAESINKSELKSAIWNLKYKELCEKVAKEEFVFYNSFYTDNNGIFKANPQYDFHADQRSPGDIRINSHGFRGKEFTVTQTTAKKILMIGDSFLWGASANPIDNCFADLIQRSGYHVYNTGIGGTDPLQYAKIAEKYTPLLKPDVVMVCLYLGNDIRAEPHPVSAGKSLYYDSNFGWLLGYDDRGRYFKNAVAAFQFLKNRKCGQCDNPWQSFLYKTVLGKAIYNLLQPRRRRNTDRKRQWVTNSLKQIETISHENGSKFLLFLIPTAKRLQKKDFLLKQNREIFKDLHYNLPTNLLKHDYCALPNPHFNNRGHKKFAEFIMEILKNNGYLPVENKSGKKNDRK